MKPIMVKLLTLAFLLLCGSALAADSWQETVTFLDQLPNGMKESQFKAWVNDGSRATFELGEKIEFNFSSESDVYVSIAYVDTHGILSLIVPQLGNNSNRLPKSVTMTFPPLNSGVNINIEPPLGQERIYFVATEKPIPQDVFRTDSNVGGDHSKLFQAADSIHLAQEFLAEVVNSNKPTGIATVVVEQTIIQRPGAIQYTTQDIVGYFAKRGSRSISKPKLDADIQFDTDSSTLTQAARDNLDVWGSSFQHPYLSEAVFQIGGHTDDVGSESYNMQLSARRAASVSDYLQSKFGIDAARLTLMAHGESSPKEQGTTGEARAANRRVEFRQLNE